MDKKKWLIAGVVVGIAFLAARWIWVDRLPWFYSTNYSELYSGQILQISDSSKITQTFVAMYPGLYRIGIHFFNQGDNTGSLVFHLKQSCGANDDLVLQVVPEARIGDNAEYVFEFPPLDESALTEYCIIIDQLATQPVDNLAVYASNTNIYPDGVADFVESAEESNQLEQVKQPSGVQVKPAYLTYLPAIFQARGAKNGNSYDIGFNLFYNGQIPATLQSLLLNLTRHKSFMFGQTWFYPTIFGVYIVGLLVLLYMVWSQRTLQ